MDDSQEEVTWAQGIFPSLSSSFWREGRKKAHKQEKQSVVLAGKGGAYMPNGEMAWWLILLEAHFNVAMQQQKP